MYSVMLSIRIDREIRIFQDKHKVLVTTRLVLQETFKRYYTQRKGKDRKEREEYAMSSPLNKQTLSREQKAKNKEQSNQPENSENIVISKNSPVVALNGNKINSQIKKNRGNGWPHTKDPTFCYPKETSHRQRDPETESQRLEVI